MSIKKEFNLRQARDQVFHAEFRLLSLAIMRSSQTPETQKEMDEQFAIIRRMEEMHPKLKRQPHES